MKMLGITSTSPMVDFWQPYGKFHNNFSYYNWSKNFKKAFIDIYLEKNWGPPYYRLKKSFKLPAGETDEHSFLSKFLPGKKEAH
jgi:sulfide:quinone oxidoreductase